MRDKNHYCAHHEDFGHLINVCKDLYKQITFIIKKGGILQYVTRSHETPKIAEQLSTSNLEKRKTIIEQRASAVEQTLRVTS